ncbi:hypothetical protein QJS10_CPB13g00028 [Acorus calamus]|uniref:Formin-like protein 18 n=1 Tax=Acorus calamus TaxID=4465 RepID=A0AAV9DK89_ACOCL|nr:hypothetical protein QJS10_CPB13g00028 [Acorus calamus]
MDPCPFVRLLVGNLALKIPFASKPARSGVHPSTSPCFAKIRLGCGFPSQTVTVPLVDSADSSAASSSGDLAATFHLAEADLGKLARLLTMKKKRLWLKVSIYTGRRGSTCGVSSGRLLGRVSVPLDLAGAESRACVFHSGWVSVGKKKKASSSPQASKASAELHMTVRSEPDPRFVFEFDGEPECSPQVFQVQGNVRQPVFTCKFGFRSNGGDLRNHRSRSMQSDGFCTRSWLSSFGSDRERQGRERKGWSITVHDLSGSPVAAASMVTPFVASPGSDRVSRSNPGGWLILRPGDGTWKPWGRLEAWRERGSSDGLGYRFELLPDANCTAGVLLAESTISTGKGGKLMIDMGSANGRSTPSSSSPACSPRSSGDFGMALWPYCMYRGFVMSSTLEGEGKCSKPTVEIGVQHVGCTEDAAVFVALSAAIDLSMDACRLFSHKLRKELYQTERERMG